MTRIMFLALLELGTLCPTMQFVVLHRGYVRFYGHVPLIEDWAECSAVRTQPLAHHHRAKNKDADAKANGVTSSCVISLKDKRALGGPSEGWGVQS